VNVVLPASELDGMNVATVSALLKLTVPATLFPPAVTVKVTVLGVTGWENVAVGAADTATPVAPEAGVTEYTAGGVVPAAGEYTTSTQ
jgi:hypothetical protein